MQIIFKQKCVTGFYQLRIKILVRQKLTKHSRQAKIQTYPREPLPVHAVLSNLL